MTKPFSLPKPTFILSIHRSGSTLLQSLLDGHSELIVDVGDSHFFHFLPKFVKLKSSSKIRFFKDVIISKYLNEYSLYYQEYLSHISLPKFQESFDKYLTNSNVSCNDLFDAYIYAMARTSNQKKEAKYFISKVLKNEYSKEFILNSWPDVKIIYLFRDPRDIYASFKVRDKKNNRIVTEVNAFAFSWKKSFQTFNYYSHKLTSTNCLMIRYEDLVMEQSKTMSKIISFLNIDYDKTLLNPTKGNGSVKWLGNAASGIKKNNVDKIDRKKYLSILNKEEINEIESLLSFEMNYLGYKLTSKPSAQFIYPLSRIKNFFRKIKHGIIDKRLAKGL